MGVGFFSDLDNTLIYSARHLREGLPPVVGLEVYQDGRLGGYMTVEAHDLLRQVGNTVPFVPVTARHFTQWERLQFADLNIREAVLFNGAVLVRDGVRDAAWDSHIRSAMAASGAAPLAELQAAVERVLNSYPVAYDVDVVENIFCVYIMDGQTLPADLLHLVAPVGELFGYRLSLQHKKLHVVPLWLSKGAAVTAVAERLNLDGVFAAGDAVLDAAMLDVAERGWVPAGSEIAGSFDEVSKVTVTAEPGLLGGQQIVHEAARLLL